MEIRNTILTFSENNENILSIYVVIYKENSSENVKFMLLGG